jgi:hypothetical protein
MERFHILDGLPATGPCPRQFNMSGRRTHREGFVVEFFPEAERSWVGNFQEGLTNYSAVLSLPGATDIIVVAGGHAYVIDPEHHELLTSFGGTIQGVTPIPEFGILILNHTTYLESWRAHAMQWRTGRISWDGIWDLRVDEGQLKGYAWNAIENRKEPFSVDLRTGDVEGGSYTRT